MSGWTIAWLLWGAAFLLIEGLALFNKTIGDTLSEHAWSLTRPYGRRTGPWVITARALIAVFLIWLTGHLVLGWWTPTHPWPW